VYFWFNGRRSGEESLVTKLRASLAYKRMMVLGEWVYDILLNPLRERFALDDRLIEKLRDIQNV
jgi:hypothetical protein